jgi:hypothetical protein
MPLLADLAQGFIDPRGPQPGCVWNIGKAPADIVLKPGETIGRVLLPGPRSIVREPRTEVCTDPNFLKRQCLEAVYNRDTKDWTCNTFGESCTVRPCGPVPDDHLFVYVSTYEGGVDRLPATVMGNPIWPKPEADKPVVEEASVTNIIMYLGLGVLAFVLLGRR